VLGAELAPEATPWTVLFPILLEMLVQASLLGLAILWETSLKLFE
jgi:hypothetical protein